MKKISFALMIALLGTGISLPAAAKGGLDRIGFGLESTTLTISSLSSSVPMADVRFCMDSLQLDAMIGFQSNSNAADLGILGSVFAIGGQCGMVFAESDHVQAKWLGRFIFGSGTIPDKTLAGATVSYGGSGTVFQLAGGLGGEFFLPNLKEIGFESAILAGIQSFSASSTFPGSKSVSNTSFGIGGEGFGVTTFGVKYYFNL